MALLKQALSIEKKPHLRDFSFSSYLNPSEEVFQRKHIETSIIPNSTLIIQKENVHIPKNKVEYGEIGVFAAEMYFNGGNNEENIDHQQMQIDQLKNQLRRPSVKSDSSWNSQSALIRGAQNSSIHNKNDRRRQVKGLLSILSCNCSCGDENSVDVEEQKNQSFSKINVRDERDLGRNFNSLMNPRITEERQMEKIEYFGIGLNKKEDSFSFQTVDLKPENSGTEKIPFQEEGDDKKSLEVFGSPSLGKRIESIFGKKLDLFAIDINTTREEIDFSHGNPDDDLASDTSSDLFEIESFTTCSNLNPFLVRQASNGSSCVTPCYAPSEASIEWSVVTASEADLSLFSESSFRALENTRKANAYRKGKEVEKRRLGILYGCKNEKAVRITESTRGGTQ